MTAKGFRRCCDTPNQQGQAHLLGCAHHVPMTDTQLVEVVQADRDVAAVCVKAPIDARWIKEGRWDAHLVVQTIAAHRIAHQSPTSVLREAIERLVQTYTDLTEQDGHSVKREQALIDALLSLSEKKS